MKQCYWRWGYKPAGEPKCDLPATVHYHYYGGGDASFCAEHAAMVDAHLAKIGGAA